MTPTEANAYFWLIVTLESFIWFARLNEHFDLKQRVGVYVFIGASAMLGHAGRAAGIFLSQ